MLLEAQGRNVQLPEVGACHSSVPKAILPHPILQDEGLPRSSDERRCVSPSIIKTIPGLLFSDWGLPNPLIIPVHQVDGSHSDNQWLPPCTPTLTHLLKLTSNKYACEKDLTALCTLRGHCHLPLNRFPLPLNSTSPNSQPGY